MHFGKVNCSLFRDLFGKILWEGVLCHREARRAVCFSKAFFPLCKKMSRHGRRID